MDFSIKKSYMHIVTIIISSIVYILPAQAHEPRLIGNGAINVAVGWRAEPAFENNINRFDFMMTDAT